jgi:hypothetical protein
MKQQAIFEIVWKAERKTQNEHNLSTTKKQFYPQGGVVAVCMNSGCWISI